jgi:hypothetical protein
MICPVKRECSPNVKLDAEGGRLEHNGGLSMTCVGYKYYHLFGFWWHVLTLDQQNLGPWHIKPSIQELKLSIHSCHNCSCVLQFLVPTEEPGLKLVTGCSTIEIWPNSSCNLHLNLAQVGVRNQSWMSSTDFADLTSNLDPNLMPNFTSPVKKPILGYLGQLPESWHSRQNWSKSHRYANLAFSKIKMHQQEPGEFWQSSRYPKTGFSLGASLSSFG